MNIPNRYEDHNCIGVIDVDKQLRDIVRVEHLNKEYIADGNSFLVLKDINLTVRDGEFVTIVGHSGCGKSTLLKIICGLVDYNDGVVERNGHKVEGPGPSCGMVFQDHRLLPWLKIKDNVGFGIKDISKAERKQLVQRHLDLVGLNGFENAYPSQLSGGMSQRAAIARGLVGNPSILLLDEPFGALDALTRIQMQKEILRIQQEEKTTMIMVTHDIDEAIYLGERIVVMSARPGEIKKIITTDKYSRRNRGSAQFAAYKRQIYNYFFEDSAQLLEEAEFMI